MMYRNNLLDNKLVRVYSFCNHSKKKGVKKMSQRVRVGNPNGKMFEVSENEQVLMEVVIDLIGMVEDRAKIPYPFFIKLLEMQVTRLVGYKMRCVAVHEKEMQSEVQ